MKSSQLEVIDLAKAFYFEKSFIYCVVTIRVIDVTLRFFAVFIFFAIIKLA